MADRTRQGQGGDKKQQGDQMHMGMGGMGGTGGRGEQQSGTGGLGGVGGGEQGGYGKTGFDSGASCGVFGEGQQQQQRRGVGDEQEDILDTGDLGTTGDRGGYRTTGGGGH